MHKTVSISVPKEHGREVFQPGVEYHFALNDDDLEHWCFWVLDYIKVYPDHDGERSMIEYHFKPAPGWETHR